MPPLLIQDYFLRSRDNRSETQKPQTPGKHSRRSSPGGERAFTLTARAKSPPGRDSADQQVSSPSPTTTLSFPSPPSPATLARSAASESTESPNIKIFVSSYGEGKPFIFCFLLRTTSTVQSAFESEHCKRVKCLPPRFDCALSSEAPHSPRKGSHRKILEESKGQSHAQFRANANCLPLIGRDALRVLRLGCLLFTVPEVYLIAESA